MVTQEDEGGGTEEGALHWKFLSTLWGFDIPTLQDSFALTSNNLEIICVSPWGTNGASRLSNVGRQAILGQHKVDPLIILPHQDKLRVVCLSGQWIHFVMTSVKTTVPGEIISSPS